MTAPLQTRADQTERSAPADRGRAAPARRGRAAVLRCAGALLAMGALAGCQSLQTGSPELRVIDASPDAGVLDLYENNSGLAYNLSFGTVTSYVPMMPGSYTLAADRAGTRQALVSGRASLAPGRHYTLLVGDVAAALQQTLLQDQVQPAPAGEISLRFVQAATRSGPVDVYLVPKGLHAGTGASGGSGASPVASPLLVGQAFGANSGYVTVPAGTYGIDVVPAGTALVASTVTLMSGAQMEYAAGSVSTVVLMDQEIVGPHPQAVTPAVTAIVATEVDGGQ